MRVAMICQPRDRLLSPEALSGSVGIVAAELGRALGKAVDLTFYVGTDGPEGGETTGPGGHRVVLVPVRGRRLEDVRELASGLAPRREPYMASTRFYRGYFEQVAERLRRDPPEVVHLHTFHQHAPLLRPPGAPWRLVLQLHDPHPTWLDVAETDGFLRAVDAVVTCSDWVTRCMAVTFPAHAAKVTTIGNGVDPSAFPAVPEQPEHASRLLYVGRLSPEKGPHVLVDAFERVAARDPRATLDLVGKGGYLAYSYIRMIADDPKMRTLDAFYGRNLPARVFRQVFASGVSYPRAVMDRLSPAARERVRLVGPVPHARLPQLYAESAVVVVPSVIEEPFGLPVAEAMAAARPVVASRVGGIPELVTDGQSGLLVPANDPAALAEALLALLADPARRRAMGEAGRRAAAERWSWRHAGERLLAVYARLASAVPIPSAA